METWTPVAASVDVPVGRVLPFEHGGDEWVVWRDTRGRLCAQPRRCPHLDHDLAEGAVADDELVCRGHGWSFDVDGRALKRNEHGRADPKGRVVTLAARDRDGTVEVGPSS
jgi:phenylpropionate dioxygenase-like ring-hydroxylating dioxygenase large terminal subunit